MVRLAVASAEAAASLHLSVLAPSGELLIRLRVDTVEFWTLENVTVLHTPDGSLVGAPFQHVNAAMGQLKKFLPGSSAAHDFLEMLHAYVVGPLDDRVLGKRDIRFKLYGESVSTRHTPELLTAPVQCLEHAPGAGGGRWLPVSVLRPFAPARLANEDAIARMKDLMRQVHCRRCALSVTAPLIAPDRFSLRRISTSLSCGHNSGASLRGLRTPRSRRAASVSCQLASRRWQR